MTTLNDFLPKIFGFYSNIKKLCISMCKNNYILNDSNDFYVRIGTFTTCILLYVLSYITISILNCLYFCNLFLNTIKYLTRNFSLRNQMESEKILYNWLSYSTVLFCGYIIDTIVRLFGFFIFSFIGEMTKMLLYYNLIVNESTYDQLNDNITKFYNVNRWGIDQIQTIGIKFVDKLRNYLCVSTMMSFYSNEKDTHALQTSGRFQCDNNMKALDNSTSEHMVEKIISLNNDNDDIIINK